MIVVIILLVALSLGLGAKNIIRAVILLRSSDGVDGGWLLGWGVFQIAISAFVVTRVAMGA